MINSVQNLCLGFFFVFLNFFVFGNEKILYKIYSILWPSISGDMWFEVISILGHYGATTTNATYISVSEQYKNELIPLKPKLYNILIQQKKVVFKFDNYWGILFVSTVEWVPFSLAPSLCFPLYPIFFSLVFVLFRVIGM